jgi:hypothetical protein
MRGRPGVKHVGLSVVAVAVNVLARLLGRLLGLDFGSATAVPGRLAAPVAVVLVLLHVLVALARVRVAVVAARRLVLWLLGIAAAVVVAATLAHARARLLVAMAANVADAVDQLHRAPRAIEVGSGLLEALALALRLLAILAGLLGGG